MVGYSPYVPASIACLARVLVVIASLQSSQLGAIDFHFSSLVILIR